MICGNRDVGFRVLVACDNCGIYQEGNTYQLSELIPPGHCYELLHSLIPYIVSFEHNGWFKWERDKNTVIVCCPAVENNVCAQLKKVPNGNEINFKYEIKSLRGRCPFYGKGAIFEINRSAFCRLCWDLFNVIYPYLRTQHNGKRILCGMSNKKGIFELIALGESS